MTPSLPTADRWRQIETILDQALDLPSEKRSLLLDEVCADDPSLRAEVEALLAADAGAGGFLVTPAGEYDADLLADAVEEIEPDLAGQQMGPYRLLREIGGGGMGTVYEAEDARLGRRVAIKLLPPEYSRDRKAKERFLREARAAAAVDHPNLCTVHDVGESDGRLYIVLSFYEGETLRERIRRGPLPIAEAREIAIQVARGLARAHEAGIVHRDIKPANVILTRRGEAKILDFGIARLGGDDASLTRTGASWGTPAYMSPEQARGERVDSRTDVWSLGVMLYEMLAGRRPFGGESMEAVVAAILTQKPEPLERVRPEVPKELARVVDRALAKDPAERYANAAEMLADLESGRAPSRRSLGRKTLRMGLLGGTLAALVLLVFTFWRPWQAAAGPPLRVALLQPVVKLEGKDPELAFVASDVMEAALATLVSLEGLQVLDPPERNEEKASEAERLREADEGLLPLLDCRKGACEVILRRRKRDGVVLGVSDPFVVHGGFENAYQLAEGVRVRVRQVYSDRSLRTGSPGGAVRPEDYSAYNALERRLDSGERLGRDELDRLDALLRTSPDLVGAYVLATGISRGQGDFDRALDYVVRAEKLAPYDPRPLIAQLRVQLEGNRLDAAPATLARLASLAPGDIRVKTAKADLLEVNGDLEEALPLREEVARRRPTWRYILKLATLEFRLGKSDSARLRLETLLASQPSNHFLRESLANLELVYGDVKRAEGLYEELIRTGKAPYLTSNLGFARFLLSEYASAAAAYRQALIQDPDDFVTRFNLATALEAQGDLLGARRIYRELETELVAAPARLDSRTRMLHAQCLVRLGQRSDAARIAGEVLKQTPEDVEVLYQAAQVYALLDEPVSALFYIDRALRKGVQRAWFTIPEFRSLERDSSFQRLLNRYSG